MFIDDQKEFGHGGKGVFCPSSGSKDYNGVLVWAFVRVVGRWQHLHFFLSSCSFFRVQSFIPCALAPLDHISLAKYPRFRYLIWFIPSRRNPLASCLFCCLPSLSLVVFFLALSFPNLTQLVSWSSVALLATCNLCIASHIVNFHFLVI